MLIRLTKRYRKLFFYIFLQIANLVSSVVYESKFHCGKNYVVETGQNHTKRWDEHWIVGKNSESAKHLY